MNVQNDISHLVRELRERIGLTQEKFAAKLGVTTPTINRWENGRARPSPLALSEIEKLIRKLGKDSTYLIEQYFPKES